MNNQNEDDDNKRAKFYNKIKKIATSNFILVPKKIMDNLKLKPEDIVNVIISKNIFHVYICKKCKYSFEGEFENPYCPNCNAIDNDLQILDEFFLEGSNPQYDEPKIFTCSKCGKEYESYDSNPYCPHCGDITTWIEMKGGNK